MLVLSGCASLSDRLQPAALTQRLVADCAACPEPDAAGALAQTLSVSFSLSRRAFSPPSRRQRDQQSPFATVSDYTWREGKRVAPPRRNQVSMSRL
jgi:hypothetical protein